MKRLSLLFCLYTFAQTANCQMKQDIAAYIEKYKSVALEEMVRCKIPASITLAQGLHESSYGKSKLSTEANNHFGIKCKEEWDGKKYYQNDDAPNECFRVYDHAEDSYADHSDFLITRSRYAGLFELPITDYQGWAKGLKASGYATNPRYAEILIKTIEENNLTQYDQQGLAMIDAKEKLFNPSTPSAAYQEPQTAAIKVTTPVTKKQESVQTETIVFNDIKPVTTQHEIKTEKREVSLKTAVANVFSTTKNDATQKEFIVNGTKAIKAQGNIDPLAIAYNYQIQYAQILAFNDMNEGDHFKDGENIFLQPKRGRGTEEKYVAQAGESMRDIAQRFGIKLRDLYQKNLMAMNDQPVAGEAIYLQEKRSSPPRTMSYSEYLKTLTATTSSATNNATTAKADSTPSPKTQYAHGTTQYTVAPSDTLYSIAKKFNVSIQQLSVLNNLQTADLRPGQTLVIGQ